MQTRQHGQSDLLVTPTCVGTTTFGEQVNEQDAHALARAHGLTPTRMALAWCHGKWRVASTIIGETSVAQIDEDLDAFGTPLPPELLAAIDPVRRELRDPAA